MSRASPPPRTWKPPDLNRSERPGGRERGADRAPAEALSGLPPEWRDELEQLRQRVHSEAYSVGYEEGRRAGIIAAERAAEDLRRIVRRLSESLVELEPRVESALVALALEIARRVVLREITVEPDTLIGVVRETLRRVPIPHGPLRLRLHPQDLAIIEERREELSGKNLSWVADSSLSRGGCVLEVLEKEPIRADRRWRQREGQVLTEVDGRVERRWRQVLAALFDEDLIQ